MMKKNIFSKTKDEFGEQIVYRFPNDYGASVIRNKYSYGGKRGLWELAVVKFENDVYEVLQSEEIQGFLTEERVNQMLKKIEAL